MRLVFSSLRAVGGAFGVTVEIKEAVGLTAASAYVGSLCHAIFVGREKIGVVWWGRSRCGMGRIVMCLLLTAKLLGNGVGILGGTVCLLTRGWSIRIFGLLFGVCARSEGLGKGRCRTLERFTALALG